MSNYDFLLDHTDFSEESTKICHGRNMNTNSQKMEIS